MELLDLCKTFIGINSVTIPNGTREIVEFLSPLFKELGGEIRTQTFPIEGHPNLNMSATFGPPDKEAVLLLNTHLDTVAPGPAEAWTLCQGNPFAATEHNGNLVGLGAADTKLAIICQLVALRNLLRKDPKCIWREPLIVLATAGEERGLLGANHALMTQFVKAKYAIDSEPSEMTAVWAHKGMGVARATFTSKEGESLSAPPVDSFALRFEGMAAHSSTPHLGKNAIDLALRFVDQLLANQKTPAFLALDGGSAPNVIPARAFLSGNGAGIRRNVDNLVASFPQAHLLQNPPEKPLQFLPADVFSAAAAFQRHLTELAGRFAENRTADFSPDHSTSSLTLAHTHAAPAHFDLSVDHRFIRPEEGAEFEKHMRSIGETLSADFPSVTINIKVQRSNPPMYGKKDTPFVKRICDQLRKAGLPGELKVKSGCTEGAVFAAYGIETVVIGPGRAENNIHKPNERVPITQLQQAVRFYEQVIAEFCL